MGYSHKAYSRTGNRDKNEDSYCVFTGERVLCAALADGMGGFSGGEIASETVIQAFEQALERDVMTLPVNIILYANDMILQRQKELGNKMKTTAAVVRIDDTGAHIAHVGDSRVYAFKDAKVVFQTLDHTAAQMSVEVGEITPQEIRSHPDRCVLTKALGSSDELRPSLTQLPKDSFDCILMCTDGFWGSVTEKDMCNCLSQSRSPQQWLELMQEIRDKDILNDDDNNTAIAIMKQREG
ncbi:MAG: serine/threonine-protein phosphatase [Ruminococcus sp.]|nr:serine/threonine-protein phosphatase [Ruminococcus sp.]